MAAVEQAACRCSTFETLPVGISNESEMMQLEHDVAGSSGDLELVTHFQKVGRLEREGFNQSREGDILILSP